MCHVIEVENINTVYKLSSVKENSLHLRYRGNSLILFREIISVHLVYYETPIVFAKFRGFRCYSHVVLAVTTSFYSSGCRHFSHNGKPYKVSLILPPPSPKHCRDL
jgi:hypothetical protein